MRYAVCNELFTGMSLKDAADLAARVGFHGMELAPYTLTDDVSRLKPIEANAVRRTIEEAGLRCAGLHWLLRSPQGLHLTTPDTAVRGRSWAHMAHLVTLAEAFGAEVLVLGSGKQRNAAGISVDRATRILRDGLAGLAPRAQNAGVTICLEALPAAITDVVNTLAQARAVVEEVASPAVRTMFDFRNTADETDSWAPLLERHFPMIAHVHLNDAEGRHPWGDAALAAYLPAFRTLERLGYRGWVSLEIFHDDLPPDQVLGETRQFLADIEAGLGA